MPVLSLSTCLSYFSQSLTLQDQARESEVGRANHQGSSDEQSVVAGPIAYFDDDHELTSVTLS